MRSALILLALLSMVTVGCQTSGQLASNDCQPCGQYEPCGHGQYAGCGARNSADFVPHIPCNYHQATEPAGPATGTYAYPYYTTRAPRDFLLDAPATIGY